MSISLEQFQKQHDFLICVDSDGCAVNNLTAKHRRCFGPCLVWEWALAPWESEVLSLWENINLYSLTRGINRFRALALALREIDRKYAPVPCLSQLLCWVEETEAFTHSALEDEIARTQSPILIRALHWSRQVNQAVAALDWKDKQFFTGVREGLEIAREFADIAVISSADQDAVEAEWQHGGMLGMVNIFMCQEAGNKAVSIAHLRKKGYAPGGVLMIGDAPADRAAAELNGIYFYPICPGKEEESWQAFPQAANQLCSGSYRQLHQRLSEELMKTLSGGKSHD